MAKLKGLLARLRELWNHPRDTWLVRLSMTGVLGVFALMLLATFWMFLPSHGPIGQVAHGVHHGAKEPEASGSEHAEPAHEEAAHGEASHEEASGEGAGLGHNPIPESIRSRRRGKLAPDHDLVEPDIEATRGLSSLLEGNVEVNAGIRLVEIPDVMASTRLGGIYNGKVFITPHLEVDSREAQSEAESRKVEIQSLISSIVSERQRDSLKSFEGQSSLKTDIQREVNQMLRNGHVTDVLFVNFYMQ